MARWAQGGALFALSVVLVAISAVLLHFSIDELNRNYFAEIGREYISRHGSHGLLAFYLSTMLQTVIVYPIVMFAYLSCFGLIIIVLIVNDYLSLYNRYIIWTLSLFPIFALGLLLLEPGAFWTYTLPIALCGGATSFVFFWTMRKVLASK
jgi:hypothetical protein